MHRIPRLHRSRAAAVVLALGLGATAHGKANPPSAPVEGPYADFNGDGYADLAVGMAGRPVDGQHHAGAVRVLYGRAGGLATAGAQLWTKNSSGILGTARSGEYFGWATATGDFNHDGYSDLAVGSPGTQVGTERAAGTVHVLYGSRSRLTALGDQVWSQNSGTGTAAPIADTADEDDGFGEALATGDFDGDGYDDLAIGVPREDGGGQLDSGMVNVLYGSAAGLAGARNQYWSRQTLANPEGPTQQGDRFGSALAVGDFENDGFDDLAIGVPNDDVQALENAGSVHVIRGRWDGLGLPGNQVWHQGIPGLVTSLTVRASFGFALATGDFDRDGTDDLAVGAPTKTVSGQEFAGEVDVIAGSGIGLSVLGSQAWTQDSAFIPAGGVVGWWMQDQAERDDNFGRTLTAGDFDHDGYVDLAIGVPFEGVVYGGGTAQGAGGVHVLYGRAGGLFLSRESFWTQASAGIVGVPDRDDVMGFAITTGDFDRDGFADLAIGTPQEEIADVWDAGAVHVLRGGPSGVSAAGAQFWHENVAGLSGVQPHDAFGYSTGGEH